MDSNLLTKALSEHDQDCAQVRTGVEKMSPIERLMLYHMVEGKFRLAVAENRITDVIIYRLAMTQLADFVLSIEQEKV